MYVVSLKLDFVILLETRNHNYFVENGLYCKVFKGFIHIVWMQKAYFQHPYPVAPRTFCGTPMHTYNFSNPAWKINF